MKYLPGGHKFTWTGLGKLESDDNEWVVWLIKNKYMEESGQLLKCLDDIALKAKRREIPLDEEIP